MAKKTKKSDLGRKPLPEQDKKKPFILYFSEKEILNAGGRRVAKEKAINAILGI